MAVDLADLIESLEREVSPPGQDLYPTVTDDEWSSRLSDAFWEARLHGFFTNYQEDDGIVVPISGTTDLSREEQQLVVLYAGYRITLANYQNVQASFRAKAGPVEYETTQSATVLKEVLTALKERIRLALSRLSDLAAGTNVAVFDRMIEGTYSLAIGNEWWVRG